MKIKEIGNAGKDAIFTETSTDKFTLQKFIEKYDEGPTFKHQTYFSSDPRGFYFDFSFRSQFYMPPQSTIYAYSKWVYAEF